MPMTQEQARQLAEQKVSEIEDTLMEIVRLADEHDIDVQILGEWDQRLTYTGRPYDYDMDCRSEHGGWYSSHC